jgi:hypothetical protein
MTDIEKARRLFRDAGLAFPTIPEELAAQLREQGNRRLPMRDNIGDSYAPSWLFCTRPLDMSPYNLQHYVHEVEETQVNDYAVVSHSGYGVNSYAIQYYLVQGSLRMFLHLGWGGVYMDATAAAARIRDCFSIADQVVAAAQSVGRFQAGERLTVVGSDFYGSYWLPAEKSRRGKVAGRKDRLDVTPLQVLTEALDWLTSCRGRKRSERGSTMPIPRVQSLLLPVLQIVADRAEQSVEEIRKRVKDEFKLTDQEIKQTHPKSGNNVFVNRVAWALAHLVMGKAIAPERKGFYKVTERGVTILKGNPSELTIKELHWQ